MCHNSFYFRIYCINKNIIIHIFIQFFIYVTCTFFNKFITNSDKKLRFITNCDKLLKRKQVTIKNHEKMTKLITNSDK